MPAPHISEVQCSGQNIIDVANARKTFDLSLREPFEPARKTYHRVVLLYIFEFFNIIMARSVS